jgi:hypothetical protein
LKKSRPVKITTKSGSHASAPKARVLDYYYKSVERKNHRKFIVVFSLIGVLSLTSVLLLAMSDKEMPPDAVASLYAVDAPASLDSLFKTAVSGQANRWKGIYIHQSKSLAGNARSLAQATASTDGMPDHFLIGNGDGCVDGELQVGHRWNQQLPAVAPTSAVRVDATCISICLVGDLDQSAPTATQMRRLEQLTGALRAHYGIAASQVKWIEGAGAAETAGRAFPAAAFHEHMGK